MRSYNKARNTLPVFSLHGKPTNQPNKQTNRQTKKPENHKKQSVGHWERGKVMAPRQMALGVQLYTSTDFRVPGTQVMTLTDNPPREGGWDPLFLKQSH